MATSFPSKIQLSLFFIVSSFFCINSQTTYVYHLCSDNSYTSLSDYGTNLDKAINQLTFDAANTYFSTNTTGLGQDQVNTFFYCRYDISPQTCQSCVATAAKKTSSCFRSLTSLLFYEECTLYYSNHSLSTIMIELPAYAQYSYRTVDLEINFNRTLGNTIADLIRNVTSEFSVSSRYFATTTARYGFHENIYALAQCNPDMSSVNCSTCLQNAFSALSTNFTGAILGQYFAPICRLSYVLSGEVLSRPWSFYQAAVRSPIFSSGTQRSSIIGVIISSISTLALCLKLFM